MHEPASGPIPAAGPRLPPEHARPPGGLGATRVRSGQQWDRPNGWAPLQWMAVEGLNAYGEADLARTIAERWMRKNIEAYAAVGALLEKCNVGTSGSARRGGGRGEYPLQVGFGWTNGVLLGLMTACPERVEAALDRHPAAR